MLFFQFFYSFLTDLQCRDDFFTGLTEWINSLNLPDKKKLSAEEAAGLLTAAMIAGAEDSLRKESNNE